MSGNTYPDLVKVFYTNLHFDGENLCSHVKGVDMEITPDVWTTVMGLKYVGLRINKGNIGVVEDFNKMQYFRSCLKNSHLKVKGVRIDGLKKRGGGELFCERFSQMITKNEFLC